MSDAYINVCAAVLLHEGKLLLTTRRPGGHLAGCWEFPGGKVNADETLEACIVRELKEELALSVNCVGELFSLAFDYPEKSIKLKDFYFSYNRKILLARKKDYSKKDLILVTEQFVHRKVLCLMHLFYVSLFSVIKMRCMADKAPQLLILRWLLEYERVS